MRDSLRWRILPGKQSCLIDVAKGGVGDGGEGKTVARSRTFLVVNLPGGGKGYFLLEEKKGD